MTLTLLSKAAILAFIYSLVPILRKSDKIFNILLAPTRLILL